MMAELAGKIATASSLPAIDIDPDVQEPPLVVYVRDLRGVVAAAPMPVGATAGALKRKAAEMTGVPEDEFALSSGGAAVDEKRSARPILSPCGRPRPARARENMQIFIQTAAGRI